MALHCSKAAQSPNTTFSFRNMCNCECSAIPVQKSIDHAKSKKADILLLCNSFPSPLTLTLTLNGQRRSKHAHHFFG